MIDRRGGSRRTTYSPGWVPAGALVLACLYLPTLGIPLDFNDDGCLAYPVPGLTLVQRIQLVGAKTVEDFHNRGPFRPVTWAHWEAAAAVYGPNALARRLDRLAWAVLAAGLLLELFRSLGIQPAAALFAGAVAFANPYRNEIWLGLGLTEAFGMPYGLAALVCAARAARSPRPWAWDVAGVLAALAALGCKNVFAAVIPAQVLLRVSAGGLPWRDAWRAHGLRAALLALPLALPVVHFVVFKLQPHHPGHYTTAPSWLQARRMLQTVVGAASLDCLGPGLLLAGVAFWTRKTPHPAGPDAQGPPVTTPDARSIWLAGITLLALGTGIYLPLAGAAWRYAQPAVWGSDLLLAWFAGVLLTSPASSWKRAAWAALACGLVPLALLNLGKQDKFGARTRLLTKALVWVEGHVPPGSQGTWYGIDGATSRNQELDWAEGLHFGWHLEARGRVQTAFRLNACPQPGAPFTATPFSPGRPEWAATGRPEAPGPGWRLAAEFHESYWLGHRVYHCYLWEREGEG